MQTDKNDRLTIDEWNEISPYNLTPGTLYSLNLFLFHQCPKDLKNLLALINKDYCPKDKHGFSCKKLSISRLNKILNGSEFNKHIINIIMKHSGFNTHTKNKEINDTIL